MILRIIIGAMIVIGGLYIGFLGVALILTSGDEGGRLLKGILLITGGLTIGGAGIFFFRESAPLSPEVIDKKIMKLAEKKQMEVPEEVIFGELGNNTEVESRLKAMIDSGAVKKNVRDERTFYIFSGEKS